MNKQSPLTLTTQLNLESTGISRVAQNSSNEAIQALGEQTLSARNIVISKHSVQMDVLLDDSWQTLRLSTQQTNNQLAKYASANVSLNHDGKQLSITPTPVSMTLSKAPQLQALLNLLAQGDSQTTAILPATIPNNKPALSIPTLKAEFMLNNTLSTLLKSAAPLQAVMLPATTKHAEFTLNILNRYGDSLHQQAVSQQKVAEILAKLAPELALNLSAKQLQVTIANKAMASMILQFKDLPTNESKQLLTQLQLNSKDIKLTPQVIRNGLKLVSKPINEQFILKNSLTDTFHQLLKEQPNKSTFIPSAQPLSSTDSPIRSWLKDSFADLKTRISDAVRYFEKLPATQKHTANLNSPLLKSASSLADLGFNTKKIDIIKLAELHAPWANTSSKVPMTTAQVMLPTHYNNSPPMIQLFQQVKAGLAALTTNTELLQHSKTATNNNNANAAFLASKEPNLARPLQLMQPLEAKLVATLIPQSESKQLISTTVPVQLSQKLDQLSQSNNTPSIDLNRLVNQAFNRMISAQNTLPVTIERELLSILRPASLSPQNLQASFNQGLEQLAVTTLAAPIISQSPTAIGFNNQHGLDALLQVLVPNFKALDSNKMLEQLQQTNLQTLANEIGQLKSNLSQVQTTPINQQQDSNPLAQFFLPMKLPPEIGQTEISLGHYKKPSKNKLESKDVWFVRLNFDYAELGQLQVTAEIMDKAVECQLLASSQDVTALAHPHLETLRHKLASHGLNIAELNLKQGVPTHHAFYQSHAIINVKV